MNVAEMRKQMREMRQSQGTEAEREAWLKAVAQVGVSEDMQKVVDNMVRSHVESALSGLSDQVAAIVQSAAAGSSQQFSGVAQGASAQIQAAISQGVQEAVSALQNVRIQPQMPTPSVESSPVDHGPDFERVIQAIQSQEQAKPTARHWRFVHHRDPRGRILESEAFLEDDDLDEDMEESPY